MIIQDIILQEADWPTRDQGQRPTCLAFVISDLNRHQEVNELSPEYAYRAAAIKSPGWTPGSGLSVLTALSANTAGLPIDSECPYQPEEPNLPIPPLPTGLILHGTPLRVISRDIDTIICSLQEKKMLGIGIRLTPNFYQPNDGIIQYSEPTLPGMWHGVLAVGLGHDDSTAERYILIRNSWGSNWGYDGRAWLPEQYIKKHIVCAFGA